MDLLMPEMDGIAATAEIKARHPAVEVIALTSFVDEDRVTAAIEAGASGFLLKDAEADDLAAAIRAAMAGEVHLDPAVAGIVARGCATAPTCRPVRLGGAWRGGEPASAELDRPRARGPRGGRARAVEQGNRRRARDGRTDRPDPRLEHPRRSWASTSRTQAALFAVQHGLGPGR